MAALAAAWAAFFLYVDPRGDFPLNDDFQYAESVRRLLSEGRLRLSEWAVSSTVSHVWLGALAGRLFSPDNQTLRFFEICLGLLGGAVYYGLLRRASLSRPRSMLGAALLLFNPIYLAMSGSFQLDVTMSVFSLGALFCFLEARRRDSLAWLAASSCLIGAALLVRQTAGFLVVGGLAALYKDGRLGLRRAAAIALPAAAAAAGYLLWFFLVHGKTWAWKVQVFWRIQDPIGFGGFAPQLNAVFLTAAFYLAPLAAGLSRPLAGVSGRRAAATAAAIAALWACAAFLQGGLPLLLNTLHSRGFGVPTLNAPQLKFAGLWASTYVWRAADLIALASALALGISAWRKAEPRPSGDAWAVLLFAAPPFLQMLLMKPHYDRYLLAAFPMLIAAVLLRASGPRYRPAPAALACGLLACAAAVGLKDYYAWNRARWEAGLHALSLGLSPEQVENGFDWDGQFTHTRNMARLLAERPPESIGPWDWMVLNRIVVLTSFSSVPPSPRFAPLARFAYRTPLSRDPQYVYSFRYTP